MVEKRTYRRLIAAMGVLMFLAALIAALSQLLLYFKSSAGNQQGLYLPEEAVAAHQPKMEWLKPETYEGFDLDSFQQWEIADAYRKAWFHLNMAYQNGQTDALKDYFSDSLCSEVDSILLRQKDLKNERVDLNHRLLPNLFSLDKQLVAFTDRGVILKQKISSEKTGQLIYSGDIRANYEVVMTLDDGKWRIRHMVKKQSISEPWEDKPIHNIPFVKVNDSTFFTKNIPFYPAGLNYYPSATPWLDFWDKTSWETVQKDMKFIRDLKLNTVRIFVPYALFGKGAAQISYLDKLDKFLELASEYDLMVCITLFDFPLGYQLRDYTAADRHLESILSRFCDHQQILAWDIKNEPDLDFGIHGKEEVIDWLRFCINRAKSYDPNHLITIGWSKAEQAHLLSELTDFVSFHFYLKPSKFHPSVESLRSKLSENKLLVLQEFGLPSFNSFFFPGGHSQNGQAKYLGQMISKAGEENIPFLLWTLYDFQSAPQSVFGWKPWQRLPQKHFGLLDKQDKPKVAYEVVKNRDPASNLTVHFFKRFHLLLLLLIIVAAVVLRYLRRQV